MFKKRFSAGLLIIISLLIISPVQASTTFSLYPLKINVQEGQVFRLAVNLNPNNQKNYTVKVNVKFPSELVSVSSWQFAGTWQPLSQPGYDSIDNNNGTLIKTAGYPGGLNKAATFGTITFKAKKTGTGTISFAGGSMALDEANTNQYNGGNQVPLSVEKVAEKPVVNKPTVITPTPTPTPTKPDSTVNEPITSETSTTGVNPPLGEQPKIITLATSTPEIISPEELRKINTSLNNLNSNLSNITSILLVIAISVLVLILIILVILIIYLFRKRRHIDRIIIREEETPQLYDKIKKVKPKTKIKVTVKKPKVVSKKR